MKGTPMTPEDVKTGHKLIEEHQANCGHYRSLAMFAHVMVGPYSGGGVHFLPHESEEIIAFARKLIIHRLDDIEATLKRIGIAAPPRKLDFDEDVPAGKSRRTREHEAKLRRDGGWVSPPPKH
jgi:hypothetical protein